MDPSELPAFDFVHHLSARVPWPVRGDPAGMLLSRLEQLGDNFFALTRSDPGPLTDLRLKRTEDAREAFIGTVARLVNSADLKSFVCGRIEWDHALAAIALQVGAKPAQPIGKTVRLFAQSHCTEPGELLSQVLCCYVNYMGSWDDAIMIADVVHDHANTLPQCDGSGRLLGLAANALAAGRNDIRARSLYARAESCWIGYWDRFIIQLRWATAEIKRFDNPLGGVEIVNRSRAMTRLQRGDDFSSADARFAEGLLLNLLALVALRTGDRQAAAARLSASASLIEGVPNEALSLPSDVVDRYRLMILWNQGTLHLLANEPARGLDRFQDAVCLATAIDSDTRSEAIALFGFALLRTGQFAASIPYLLDGENTCPRELNPTQHRMIRKLLAFAYSELGDAVEASRWLRTSIPSDALGPHGSVSA